MACAGPHPSGSASAASLAPDIRPARLPAAHYAQAFADAAPRYSRSQALVEAERCLYCFDAPCTTACPTGIDVPSFIRRISDDNLRDAARSILESNPLGGTCARVCPTELLCEQACVRTAQQGKPVEIGRLQRYAVDAVMDQPIHTLLSRADATGQRFAVVGAGPAGLACAIGLARLGHAVNLYDAHPKGGGLNEYGLASYKTADNFAQAELGWLLGIGGIRLHTGWRLRSAAQLAALRAEHHSVYLAIGLDQTHGLGVPGEHLAGVRDAVAFIAELRQASDKSALPVGRRVVVIGGGMTAVDAAVQSKLLGADEVHIVYRRGPAQMGASQAEQDWALKHGVSLHHWLAPDAVLGSAGHAVGVRFARQQLIDGHLQPTGEHEILAADMVLKAIGQQLESTLLTGTGLSLAGGRIRADDDGRTGVPGLYAGGDCRLGGRDLTVEAVRDGKRAALALHEIAEVKRRWPDRAMVVSLMVPCTEAAWKAILPRVEDTGCDAVELNFGCPHGMSERGMGAAVGQVPEYIERVTRWCKQYSRLPVIVKLTPNITDIRLPAAAARRGGADAVSLINTINSVMGVDPATLTMSPATGGMGSHGGYCGPAVEPIALNMVAEISRSAETAGLPISGIGGVGNWRDALDYIALGAGNVQVCTAAMVYGFKIVQEMASPANWTAHPNNPMRQAVT